MPITAAKGEHHGIPVQQVLRPGSAAPGIVPKAVMMIATPLDWGRRSHHSSNGTPSPPRISCRVQRLPSRASALRMPSRCASLRWGMGPFSSWSGSIHPATTVSPVQIKSSTRRSRAMRRMVWPTATQVGGLEEARPQGVFDVPSTGGGWRSRNGLPGSLQVSGLPNMSRNNLEPCRRIGGWSWPPSRWACSRPCERPRSRPCERRAK